MMPSLRADRANARVLEHGDQAVPVTTLLQWVARLAEAMPPPSPGSHIALAFDHDRPAFLATLLAIWHRGHAAALPATARLRQVGPVMARPEVVLLAHDSGAGTGLDARQLLASPGEPASELRELPLAGALTLFSATADGSLQAWHLTAPELEARLRRCVDELRLPSGTRLQNAFGPAFPPALLPGLLAPLAAGATIVDGSADRGAEPDIHTLVAPVAALRALASDTKDGVGLRQVVPVAGQLDARSLAPLQERHITIATVTPMTASDDRRTTLEHALLQHPAVVDAAVAIVATADGPRAFAALVATDPAYDAARLPTPPDLPLEVHVVPRLPRDRDGQLADETLLQLLGRAADGSLPSRELHFRRLPVAEGERRRFRTQLPVDFFAFAGHFPTYPVLSGAAQLHELVLPCLRLVHGGAITVVGFSELKFLSRIAPGDIVEIAVAWPTGRDTAEFEILRDNVRCSAGRAMLRGEATAT